MQENEELFYAIALSLLTKKNLNFLTDDEKFNLKPNELYDLVLKRCPFLKMQGCYLQLYNSDPLLAAKEVLERIELEKQKVTYWQAEDYPYLLKQIADFPLVVYYQGTLPKQNSIAIVGSRAIDWQSNLIAERLAFDFAKSGYNVISGMAMGIDKAGHVGALKAGGTTCAVLGCSLERVYPPSNRDLWNEIKNNPKCCLLSEFPPGMNIERWTFVKRNRIISGLSTAVCVVKAAKKSGALITADFALEQNRELFVCPGCAYDDKYAGCHELLLSGADILTKAEDLLDVLAERLNTEFYSVKNNLKIDLQPGLFNNLNQDEIAVLEIVQKERVTVDDLIRQLNKKTAEVNGLLMSLELQGYIKRQGNFLLLEDQNAS